MKLLKTMLTLVLIGLISATQSQTFEISGMVQNLTTGINVPNHFVYFTTPGIEDTISTQTDEEGFFTQLIEVNYQDSFFISVSTLNPCTSNMLTQYFFAEDSNLFVNFEVCNGFEEPDSCMAWFNYYIDYYADSSYFENDSVNKKTLTVFFFDQSIGEPTDWIWDFGDGTTSEKKNPVHTYAANQQYEVTFSISSSECQSTTAQTIYLNDTIEQYCEAYFGYELNYDDDLIFIDSTNYDTTINDLYQVKFFDYSMGNPEFWYWSFGDGTYSTEQNPVHNYSSEGNYRVTLAMGNDQCSDSIEMNIYIEYEGSVCMASFFYDYMNWMDSTIIDPVEIDMQTLYFYDMSIGNIKNWFWDFGDGSVSTLQNPQHTYTEAGEYFVSLKVAGDNCENSYEELVWVGKYPIDTTWNHDCFAMFFPVNIENNTVEFINESFGEITSYNWNFGDGNTSIEENPIHTYEKKGEYRVTLTVESDTLCNSSVEMYVWVDNYNSDSTLVALFIPEFKGTEVTFHNQSQGDIWNYHWDFGDNTTDDTKNPTHIYGEIGTYIVTLGIGNASMVNTFTMEINLEDETFIGFFDNSGTTGINKTTNEISKLQVHPIPVANTANISLNSNENTTAELSVISLAGKVLLQKNITIYQGHNEFSINTSSLENGIYFIQTTTISNKKYTQKIVK